MSIKATTLEIAEQQDCVKGWRQTQHSKHSFWVVGIKEQKDTLMILTAYSFQIPTTVNQIGESGLKHLGELLKTNTTLIDLHFGGTTEWMKRQKAHWWLSSDFYTGNCIQGDGAIAITEGLKTNTTLKKLEIACQTPLENTEKYTKYQCTPCTLFINRFWSWTNWSNITKWGIEDKYNTHWTLFAGYHRKNDNTNNALMIVHSTLIRERHWK